MAFRKAILAIATLILLASCGKDEAFLQQPAGIRDLVKAFQDGWELVKVDKDVYNTNLEFKEGKLKLDVGSVWVYDCTSKEPDNVYLGPGDKWAHGTTDTGIKCNNEVKDIDALPVYLYFTRSIFVVHLSNGAALTFQITPTESSLIPDPTPFTMPVVRITHNAAKITKEEYVDATIVIEDPDQKYSTDKSVKLPSRIRGRGQSSWNFPKTPLRIKLNEEYRVLGMPKNKDWCLVPNYPDKSLLRNSVAMKTSEILGMPWTPRYRKVEVYLNNQYMGVYDLYEAKEVTKNKVNINLEKGDLYLEVEVLEYDFMTEFCEVPLLVKEPKDASAKVKADLKAFANEFEQVLYSNDFADPDKGYAKYIDVKSFIDNYIIEELAKDIDGCVRKSSFLIYDATACKLQFYHQWDFDISYGNAYYFPGGECYYDGWFIRYYNSALSTGAGWYRRLYEDPAFADAVRARWKEVYDDLGKIPECVDAWVAQMGDAPARNFQKWDVLGIEIWPNVQVNYTYEGEVAYLKKFYTDRLLWMNRNL